MGNAKRWWKPTKHCVVLRSSGCIVVRWQRSDTISGTRRNWAELHSDILLLIFKKLGAIGILKIARLVCRNWNNLTSSEPMLWRRVDMTGHDFSLSQYALERIAKVAIRKSEGKLEEFYADGLVTDGLLQYIATRTNCLKRLGIFLCPGVSTEGLMALAQRPVCQQLKCLRFNDIWYSRGHRPHVNYYAADCDTDALYIGTNMQQLRSLELIGSRMTNKGLEAILEGCPHLEFLDIRHCFNLVLDENIMAKLSRIRDLKFPDTSADKYMKSISGDYYYYYYYFGPCPCCFEIDSNPDEDYDPFYYETFPTLDEIYGDVMFLY